MTENQPNPHAPLGERRLSVSQAARILKVSQKKLRRMCRDREIPHHQELATSNVSIWFYESQLLIYLAHFGEGANIAA
jgi:hypothetical protein